MVNYTTQDKSTVKPNDNYVDDIHTDVSKRNVSCFMCIFCGKNEILPVLAQKYLCAENIREVTNVQAAGTCDAAKSRFKWYNRLYAKLTPIKNKMLERTGFKFLGR